MRELSQIRGNITIPGAGTSSDFNFAAGGKQGGVETPDEWNMLVEAQLDPVRRSWETRGFGIKLPTWQNAVTHAVWADNIWLFAASRDQLDNMVKDLTQAVYECKLQWKASSLQVLCGGMASQSAIDLTVVTPLGNCLSYTSVDHLEVLGTRMDAKGSSLVSLQFRLERAEANFWANSRILMGPGSIKSKLKAWFQGPATSAIYDCGGWACTQSMLQQIRRWEYRWLRKMFRFKWKSPIEGKMQFQRRTARVLEQWFVKYSYKMLHHRLLEQIFKEAWHEKEYSPPAGKIHAREFRMACHRRWWDTLRHIPTRYRDEGERHSAPGKVTEWEDPIVFVFGTSWRDMRDSQTTLSGWMSLCEEFTNSICEKWGLPKLQSQPVCVEESQTCPPERKRRKISIAQSLLPESHNSTNIEPLQVTWARRHGCFLFVVDCKPLANVANGKSALCNPSLEGTFDQILTNLEAILQAGWMPSGLWSDPIKWASRQHNVVADYICNACMDNCRPWCSIHDVHVTGNFNVLVHSDGGARKECGAAGFVVELAIWNDTLQNFTLHPLVTSGVY